MNNLLQTNSSSIYIHIPFCIKKCNYCAFVSYTNINEYENNYVNALIDEIKFFSSNNTITTVYFGGGTPNLLKLKYYDKIFNALKENFNISQNAEITMEFNPKITNLKYMTEIKNFGVNRISLGVQSFNDKILSVLGRLHNSKDTINAISDIKSCGIENYSLDLIYGIFGQTIKDLSNDLNFIKSFSPKHISTYGLKIENGTPFEMFDKTNLPDEDLCAQMYLLICNELAKSNYNHYEISNFAFNNYEAKHNLTYWNNKEYFAFGAAAHGYLNKIRYKNPDSISDYISNPIKKEILNINSDTDILQEEIFLKLRLKNGINLKNIAAKYNYDLYAENREFINSITDSGHAIYKDCNLSLTEKGFLLYDYISEKLVP